MRIFILVIKPHPQSLLRGVVCETNVYCNVHPASFNQLANETRYSRGSFARNSSRWKTPTTESPPSVKQSWTTSNPERCSFVAFEPPKTVILPVDLNFLLHASNAPSLVSRLTLRLSIDNRRVTGLETPTGSYYSTIQSRAGTPRCANIRYLAPWTR